MILYSYFVLYITCVVFTQDHLYQPKPHLSYKDVDETLRYLPLLTSYVVKLTGYQIMKYNYVL